MPSGPSSSEARLISGNHFGLEGDVFEFGDHLGSGGQGTVHMCTRLKTRKRYAVKRIDLRRFELRERAKVRVNLRRECDIMRELTHPRIVNLLEAFWENDVCLIVMDCACGGDLHCKLEAGEGLGPELSSKYIFRQLLEGTDYMHSHRVVHRDLKPQNILITRSYSAEEPIACLLHDVKIADFGLSKCLKKVGEQGPAMTAVGTLEFAAPEVLAGDYDEMADFWSLGVVLFMMLCGSYPFEIDRANFNPLRHQEIVSTVQDSDAWRETSQHGKDIVSGLLTTDPDHRLGLDGCVRHPWLEEERALEQQAIRSASIVSCGQLEARSRHALKLHPLLAQTSRICCEQSVAVWQELSGLGHCLRRGASAQSAAVGAVQAISGSADFAVDSFKLHLRDGAPCAHGDSAAPKSKTWNLQPGEAVIAVMQEYCLDEVPLGCCLVFYTSERQIIALQGTSARRRSRFVVPAGSQLVGLQFDACTGGHLVGIHVERVTRWNTGAVDRIAGWVGHSVDRVEFRLRNGSTHSYGRSGGGELQGPWVLARDELIIAIEHSRRDGYLGAGLCIYTSKGRIIQFLGMAASHSLRFAAPLGRRQICGIGFEGGRLATVSTCPWSGNLDKQERHEVGAHGSEVKRLDCAA